MLSIALFKELLAVPTRTGQERLLIRWLLDYFAQHEPTAKVRTDKHGNVYVNKGLSSCAPCVAAHIDSVQPLRSVDIDVRGDYVRASVDGKQVGFGADDKAGVFVCLNLIRQADDINAAFFVSEEIGCKGAYDSDPAFFVDVGCVIEYDCPSRNMLSYTSSGTRLFRNGDAFIRTALPALLEHGTVYWQRHPYTDVMALRHRFDLSCLNLSCGYYNWHAADEYVFLPDVQHAVAQGSALIHALGRKRYSYPVGNVSEAKEPAPDVAIGPLWVPPPNHFASAPPLQPPADASWLVA